MYGNLPETARYRIDDHLRRAEAYRLAKGTRRAAAERGHARSRSIGKAFVAAILWPVRH
ncbi:MAG TPA: hypothetical protein VKA30_10920 [Actinomycetota bacterium]|nr:hypothetical protein [Actinomycetota bacterium]